jgi:hypothetical protein
MSSYYRLMPFIFGIYLVYTIFLWYIPGIYSMDNIYLSYRKILGTYHITGIFNGIHRVYTRYTAVTYYVQFVVPNYVANIFDKVCDTSSADSAATDLDCQATDISAAFGVWRLQRRVLPSVFGKKRLKSQRASNPVGEKASTRIGKSTHTNTHVNLDSCHVLISGHMSRYPYILISYPTSGHCFMGSDIGHNRYREIPDIGSQNQAQYRVRYQDIRISGHVLPDIGTPDIGIGCSDILSDIVPDIMTFP